MVSLWVEGKKGLGESLPYVFFGLFGNEETLHQRLKRSFCNNLSLWIHVYIDGSIISLIDFVDWLGSC